MNPKERLRLLTMLIYSSFVARYETAVGDDFKRRAAIVILRAGVKEEKHLSINTTYNTSETWQHSIPGVVKRFGNMLLHFRRMLGDRDR